MAYNQQEIEEVLKTRLYFTNLGLWPPQPGEIDPSGWLDNFEDDDKPIAAALLDAFVHFDRRQTLKLFTSAFHSLSYGLTMDSPDGPEAWQTFLDNVAVTFPADSADPSGSGHIFIREARTKLGLAESQLFEPDDLVREIGRAAQPVDVVIVDDFAGTGTQFVDMWRHEYVVDGQTWSFRSLHQQSKLGRVFYTPAVSTQAARDAIGVHAPTVVVHPAHLLPRAYSVNSADSIVVPTEMADAVEPLLRKYAARAGYDISSPYGYGELGLAISFEHSMPDNTLPIFWSEKPGWKTLRKRL